MYVLIKKSIRSHTFVASKSAKSSCKIAISGTMYPYLSEYTCSHIHQWTYKGPYGCHCQWNDPIYPQEPNLHDRSPHPCVGECSNGIDQSPDYGKGKPHHKDQKVVEYQLDVLVHDTVHLVDGLKQLGTFVFSKAVLKVQLENKLLT